MSLSSSAPGPAEAALSSLNPAQCRAVTSKASTVAILAGPGSGKTHTLTSRVVWLIDNIGYQPQDVIVATFTVKAAREMKERIGKALGGGRENKIVLGTFHSIARRYLAAYGKRIGLDQKFGIADDADSRAIIQRICKRLDLKIDPKAARSWISKKKAKGTEQPSPKRTNAQKVAENPEWETCYHEYQEQLARSNLLDYDDLLTKCVELLKRHPSCVSNVQTVLIDEYQDTNGIQYELMKLFAQARHRITVVGDPDQSIYGWRSAEVKNLFRLLREFPGTDEVSLEENYRSSSAILDVSLKVIQQDTRRYEKVLKPTHKKGTRPVLRRLGNAAQEAEWVVAEIRRIIFMSGNMMNHDDVAILLRSAALSRNIESSLGKAGIPYRMVGGHKFYDRAEIKVVINYLRLISQPENNDSLARVINVPRRGIGEATVKTLLEEAELAKMSLWSLLTKHCRGERKAKTNIKAAMETKINKFINIIESIQKKIDSPPASSPCYHLVDMIENLMGQLDFTRYLEETYPDDHEARMANMKEFKNLAADFMRELNVSNEEDKLPDIKGLEQVEDKDALGKFLSNIALASDAQQKGDGDNKPNVTISTIHAAKGLEWPVVFIPAVYNGSIPHSRAEDLDEERRLLYVAMTRAQSLLYLSCPNSGSHFNSGGGEKTELSRFIPSEVHPYFAKKGPSFNSDVITEVGRILGREDQIPSAEKIYKNMPLMERVEDDLHPIDPDERNPDSTAAAKAGNWQRRPRGPQSSAADVEEAGLLASYRGTTTMDAAQKFTMSALPGFTTATAHQATMQLAAKEAAASGTNQYATSKSSSKRGGTTKRPADQPSMMNFLSKRQKSAPSEHALQEHSLPQQPGRPFERHSSATADLPALKGVQRQPEKVPAIAPDLASHKLSSNRIAKPSKLASHTPVVAQNHYPNFSSSPPKEPSAAEKEDGDEVPPDQRERPASSFHVTTTSIPPGLRGFSRPAAMKKPTGMAPIDRLNKPFKPPTMKPFKPPTMNHGGRK